MIMETLGQEELRVQATLVEKCLATPDYYPMTINALKNACNQKTNRIPVSHYDEETIQSALASLKAKCYVAFMPYGNRHGNYKYRHFWDDARFNLDKQEMALLSVMMNRGPQTLNELKKRTATMVQFEDLREVEGKLKDLRDRKEPPVAFMEKKTGWKEPRWTHTFMPLEEIEALSPIEKHSLQ